MENRIRKMFIGIILWFAWSLLCIYGTYNNTVKLMEIHTVENGYEVYFPNTEEVHYYEARM